MKDRKTVAKEILKLIDKETDKLCVPIQQGNSIRIKHMVVRESRYGFLVFNILTQEQVARTFSKTAALAIAKSHAEGATNRTARILKIDEKIQQKYNDCVFFKHTIYFSDDHTRKQAAEIRYDVAWDDVLTLRSELDHYIFD
jgi:hypothetical protein